MENPAIGTGLTTGRTTVGVFVNLINNVKFVAMFQARFLLNLLPHATGSELKPHCLPYVSVSFCNEFNSNHDCTKNGD